MGFLATISTAFSLCAIFLALAPLTNSMDATFQNSLESFGQDLFGEIAKSNKDKNIVYSPLSVQTALAMVRMGADGQTAIELDHGLGFTGQTTESVANSYHALLTNFENSDLVTLANRIYLNNGIELQGNFKDILNKKFFSSAESINFAQSQEAVNSINNWVASKTNQLIKHLLGSTDVDAFTRFVLLNAIHFKGDWLKPFNENFTQNRDFYIAESNTIKVPMMRADGYFDYANFENLDATAVRLPYNNSDLSMLIFLPNSRTGLAAMQDKLMHVKLESLTQKMQNTKLVVNLPKFKADFTIELTNTLKNLGMVRIFETADLGKMLKSPEAVSISKVIHKAVIEVNEHGTEAAAVTAMFGMYHSVPTHSSFIADHPFYYVVLNADNVVLFQGNVVTF